MRSKIRFTRNFNFLVVKKFGRVCRLVCPLFILILFLIPASAPAQEWWDTYNPETAWESLFYLSKREYRVDDRLRYNLCPWQSIRLISNRWTSVQIDILVKKEDFHAFERSQLEADLHDFYMGKLPDDSYMVQRGFPCHFKTSGHSLPLFAFYDRIRQPSDPEGPIPAEEGTYGEWEWKVTENNSVMASRSEGEYWHYSISQWLWVEESIYNRIDEGVEWLGTEPFTYKPKLILK